MTGSSRRKAALILRDERRGAASGAVAALLLVSLASRAQAEPPSLLPVIAVFPGMAGERAGIRVGDEIPVGDGDLDGASDVYAPEPPLANPFDSRCRETARHCR